jgi:hypothetical protein
MRETASVVAILAADAPERRLGLRVAGDLLDGGLLAARAAVQPEARPRAREAAPAVAPVDTAYWPKACNRLRRLLLRDPEKPPSSPAEAGGSG